MPGKKRRPPEPSAYIVEVEPGAAPLWADVERTERRIEAFPIAKGVATPQWTVLPPRRIVEASPFLDLPAGARKLPLYDPTGDPVFGPVQTATAAAKRFLFVSEGFGDDGEARFFSACGLLADRMMQARPFDDLRQLIRIDGLFLPLRNGAVVDIECRRGPADLAMLRPTLFGTQSCLAHSLSHLWGGDEDRVRAIVSAALGQVGNDGIDDFDFLAVLIDSTSYGGAGSSGPLELKPRIAWATTGHRDSLNILLHELGHAFGLQDEYDSEYAGPPKPWRNISAHWQPKDTPWQGLVTENREALTRHNGISWPGDADAVGTFQGAGYDRLERFRPSYKCRMREVRDRFCPVCSAVIRSKVDPDAPASVAAEE